MLLFRLRATRPRLLGRIGSVVMAHQPFNGTLIGHFHGMRGAGLAASLSRESFNDLHDGAWASCRIAVRFSPQREQLVDIARQHHGHCRRVMLRRRIPCGSCDHDPHEDQN